MMKEFLNRNKFLNILDNVDVWDIIIIGGGATGLGLALDSASRGYKTLLLEKSDFSKGTSSRSTKLIHGGIRYLAQGNLRLVYEALQERGYLLKNAPHLVKKRKFIIPIFNWSTGILYWTGLKLYEWLSGSLSFGKSTFLSRNEIIKIIPEIKSNNLKGGVLYYDGQFDDSRLSINLVQTCFEKGGILLNYFQVKKLIKKNNKISGLLAYDVETNKEYFLQSKVVINATGVFAESIAKMDGSDKLLSIQPSQGTHVVLNKSFFSSKKAIVIPKTKDGRVLFCVPWYDHVLVGTTDISLGKEKIKIDPIPLEQEIDFILETFKNYFIIKPKKNDILSAFSGLRPLFLPIKNNYTKTKDISRSHKIIISSSGLISIIGGKWTTYRKMAEETIDKAIIIGKLEKKASITKTLKIYGFDRHYWKKYKKNKNYIKEFLNNNSVLYKNSEKNLFDDNSKFFFTESDIIWMIRNEMARNVEDILARRSRILFLNAKQAINIAPKIAFLMAKELSLDKNWEKSQIKSFKKLAMKYYYPTSM